jgi:hypothetical protein
MAGWRQAIEVVMTDEEVARLLSVSRSRTEPASRVQRAQMLLAYRENPSFFAVGQGGWCASSDGATLHRTGAGLWAVDGAR